MRKRVKTPPLMFVNFEKAVHLLKNEHIVAMPTETVYGLAARADSSTAVSKIYHLKKRPSFNPLIVHIHDIEALYNFAQINNDIKSCCHHFWKNKQPLTVVVPLKEDHPLSSLVTAGLPTVAVRIPHHDLAVSLIREVGPLAAPSANVSNSISPTSPMLVMGSFKEDCPPILEGGVCSVGVESTILDLSTKTPVLLRPGGVTKEMLEAYFNQKILTSPHGTIKAPGQMKHHYSPGCPVIMNKTSCLNQELLLGFGPTAPSDALNLSPSGDLVEAASHLFEYLSILSKKNPKAIVVMPIPNEGMGLAINDRLSRAASL